MLHQIEDQTLIIIRCCPTNLALLDSLSYKMCSAKPIHRIVLLLGGTLSLQGLRTVLVFLFFSEQVMEAVKYYFADFVRKGGTHPFIDIIFGKEGGTD